MCYHLAVEKRDAHGKQQAASLARTTKPEETPASKHRPVAVDDKDQGPTIPTESKACMITREHTCA